ncbi:MAG: SGNH/GDSL hydrolase family protein [Xanthomonadales bacterium]|nr:SGNH/GDSL hydrolase family protein [Xanthomonadales bacterium]
MRLLRWLRDAWVILGLTLLLVLILDAALKVTLDEHGLAQVDPNARAPDRESADVDGDDARVEIYWSEHGAAKNMRWEPYVYWRRDAFSGQTINVDGEGLRSTWQPASQPAAVIWAFGGSSVWGTGVADESTVPSQLARTLSEPGRPVRVLNFGESGYVSTQSLLTLQQSLAERPPPDLVVFLGGANDVYAALQARRAGWPQNEASRQAEFRLTSGLDNYLAGAIHLFEGLKRLSRVDPEPIDETALAREVVERVGHNLRVAQALAREFDFQVYYFWQPTVFSKPLVSDHERRVIAASLAWHRDLQLAADQAVRQAGAIRDLSDVFAGHRETLFLDFVHLGPEGNRLLAERIAASVSGGLQTTMAIR